LVLDSPVPPIKLDTYMGDGPRSIYQTCRSYKPHHPLFLFPFPGFFFFPYVPPSHKITLLHRPLILLCPRFPSMIHRFILPPPFPLQQFTQCRVSPPTVKYFLFSLPGILKVKIHEVPYLNPPRSDDDVQCRIVLS